MEISTGQDSSIIDHPIYNEREIIDSFTDADNDLLNQTESQPDSSIDIYEEKKAKYFDIFEVINITQTLA